MINSVIVTCDECGKRLDRDFPLAEFYRSRHDGDPPDWWRLDPRAKGGGPIANGLREWFDDVSDQRGEVAHSSQVVDEAGAVVSTTYTIPCSQCKERVVIRAETVRALCNAWAVAGMSSVSLADLRSAAVPRH